MEDVDEDNILGSDVDMNERAGTPSELIEAAVEATNDLLPSRSKSRYEKVFDDFTKWKKSKNATSNSERVCVAYFKEMIDSQKKPTTLWAHYSMLKSTLKIFASINIESYAKLTAMLKKNAHGYVPKKAKTFNEIEVQQFLENAPDVLWLDVKVTHNLTFPNFTFVSNSFLYMSGCFSVWHLRMLSIA